MKKLRMLGGILRQTNSDKILISYILFVLVDALVILIMEPGISRYTDALWYCYEVISTTGFGELVVTTHIGRLCSILLTVYSLIIIAIITGVVTNFYIQIIEVRQKDTITSFLDSLEHIDELDKDELTEIANKVKKFRK